MSKEAKGEPLDRNKSATTHRVTAIAAAYLRRCGCKPLETEVPISNDWGIADLGGFVYPTHTEAEQLKLFHGVDITGGQPNFEELIWRFGHLFTVICEVKVTRGDFQRDRKGKFSQRHPAHLCFLAYPKKMMDPKELPEGWFGLAADVERGCLQKVYAPTFLTEVHPQHPGDVIDFVAAVAIRCDYRTRYARYRTWVKMYRAKENY